MFEIVTGKKDVESEFINNPRYVCKEHREKGILKRIDIGFVITGWGKRKSKTYWYYMQNDYDLTCDNPALMPARDNVERYARLSLIQKYGDEYYDKLKLHIHENCEDYDYEVEKIDRWLQIRKEKEADKSKKEAE